MSSTYNLLLKKIEKFIKRYYINLIIKGVLYFLAIVGLIFVLYTVLEFFGYFSKIVRAFFFYSFIAVSAFLLIKYIIIPLFKLFKIGKTLDEESAAIIIGKHFQGIIDDKIVNVLQLHKFIEQNDDNIDLLFAGIEQKSKKLVSVPFDSVINYKDNFKYALWAAIPLVIIITIFILSPFVIFDSTSRIIKYDATFERPAPFSVSLLNESLQVFQNKDFKLKMEVEGSALPEKLSVEYDGVKYSANKKANNLFNYSFSNVQRSKNFILHASGYKFGPYRIDVVPQPVINNFTIDVNSPSYTGIENKTFRNHGDINVALGSNIKMFFNTRFTEDIRIYIDGEERTMEKVEDGIFSFEKEVFENFEYKVFTRNEYTNAGDSLRYNINIIPDRYPEIAVEQHEDPVLLAHKFFTGNIRDDYGFDRLKFKYRIIDERQDEKEFSKKNIRIDKTSRNQSFTYHFDLNSINIRPGQSIEYHFAVWDNDAINGPKKTRSRSFTFRAPSRDEITDQAMKDHQEIRDELGSSTSELSSGRDEIEQLRRNLLEKENIGWEEKESFKEIIDRHDMVKEKLEELSRKKKEAEKRQEQFKEQDEDIKKMQEELDKLFDEAVSKEMEELFEKIREELDKLGRDEMHEYLEKMDFELTHFEHQLERIMEMYKMLEFKNILQESIDHINSLSEEQSGLMEEQKDHEGEIGDDFYEKQESIKDDFEKVSDLLDSLDSKNQEMQRPQNIPDTRDMQHNINYDMQKALDEMMEENLPKTLEHQQQSIDGLNEMSQMLSQFQSSMFQEDLAEDAKLLRQLLQNLLRTSFNQEDIMKEIRNININDPRYFELIQDQRRLVDDLQVIEDSLIALSKRQMHVESYIGREIAAVNMNIEKAIRDLIDRRRHSAASRQQFAMTHVNNLALMLNESLQDMQMQMAMMQGMGEPDQTGQGAPSIQDIIDQQEKANQMLEQMREGHQPEPGETGEQMSHSEQLARMSAQQEAIRNMLRELTDEIRKDHTIGTGELESLQQEMEQTELDIIKDQISRQTMIRQERILTRLLEHENALMKREKEEKRVGNIPDFYKLSNPEEFFEYNKIESGEMEFLKRKNIKFNNFYDQLIDNYFLKFKE